MVEVCLYSAFCVELLESLRKENLNIKTYDYN